ncbi:MAG: hypothetical protein J7K96_12505 [Desulfobacteraceae bacterium]|nr:hypothetical protein [Desulfobacteraceae bacterium]
MSKLTKIQNGIFHLSHKNMGITSETFLTDKYIDIEQAEYFTEISKPQLIAYPDNDYPFTLVDHYVLNSDLEIEYDYNALVCSAFPKTAYLSIHNISIEDYTGQRARPAYYINEITGKEPYENQTVTAWQLEVHNAEMFVDEFLQKGATTCDDSYNGYGENIYVRVDSLTAVYWTRTTDTDLMKRCNPPTKKTTCLHPSNIRPEPAPVNLIVISSDNPCIGQPYLPTPPRSNCYYPLPPERSTPAAKNWSYNHSLSQ